MVDGNLPDSCSESKSPEPIAFEILHRERANKVFGKRLHATARVLLVDPTTSTLSTLLFLPMSSNSMSDQYTSSD
jgi:hypothetical protein